MSKKQHYHVTHRSEGWAVVGEGNARASSLHKTQSGAIGAGRELAQKAQSELRIHGRDNRIREGWSYGNDPHPPKGIRINLASELFNYEQVKTRIFAIKRLTK